MMRHPQKLATSFPRMNPKRAMARWKKAMKRGRSWRGAINLPALEALLMSTHHPLTAGRLAQLLDLSSTKPIRRAIKTLNSHYEQDQRSFRIEQVAGGYQILTLPDYGSYLQKLHQKEGDAKLSKAVLECSTALRTSAPQGWGAWRRADGCPQAQASGLAGSWFPGDLGDVGYTGPVVAQSGISMCRVRGEIPGQRAGRLVSANLLLSRPPQPRRAPNPFTNVAPETYPESPCDDNGGRIVHAGK